MGKFLAIILGVIFVILKWVGIIVGGVGTIVAIVIGLLFVFGGDE